SLARRVGAQSASWSRSRRTSQHENRAALLYPERLWSSACLPRLTYSLSDCSPTSSSRRLATATSVSPSSARVTCEYITCRRVLRAVALILLARRGEVPPRPC